MTVTDFTKGLSSFGNNDVNCKVSKNVRPAKEIRLSWWHSAIKLIVMEQGGLEHGGNTVPMS